MRVRHENLEYILMIMSQFPPQTVTARHFSNEVAKKTTTKMSESWPVHENLSYSSPCTPSPVPLSPTNKSSTSPCAWGRARRRKGHCGLPRAGLPRGTGRRRATRRESGRPRRRERGCCGRSCGSAPRAAKGRSRWKERGCGLGHQLAWIKNNNLFLGVG